MYGWMWRHLPGPLLLRLALCLLIAVAVVLALFTIVFPWVDQHFPLDEVRISGAATLAIL